MNDARLELKEDLCSIPLKDQEHTTNKEVSLSLDDATLIRKTLLENDDLFAWTALGMPGVHPNVITHKTYVYKSINRLKEEEAR